MKLLKIFCQLQCSNKFQPVVKDVFNGIVKGSRSFTESEVQKAISHFTTL